MITRIGSAVTFHRAGQGLFSTGALFDGPEINEFLMTHPESTRLAPGIGQIFFDWVYDCGSTHGVRALEQSVRQHKAWRSAARSPASFDLIVISHFDRDHVNRLISLIAGSNVKILLLPLMTLEQRLILASTEDVRDQSDYFRFLTNPAEYLLLNLQNESFEKILFVEASRGETSDQESPTKRLILLQSEATLASDSEATRPARVGELGPDDERGFDTRVQVLVSGARLQVRDVWEFIPYNDSELRGLDDKMIANANDLAHKICSSDSDKARTSALKKLKALYEAKFKTSEERNRISLFMYTGPIPLSTCIAVAAIKKHSSGWAYSEKIACIEHKGSALYTGDGSLTNKAEVDRLKAYIGHRRFASLSMCQVMHHGSRNNWYEGAAKDIDATFNIFSSNSAGDHPHAEVLRDFWTRSPLQADADHRVDIRQCHIP